MAKFQVQRNHCKCHPETCNCNPYAIHEGFKKFTTIFDRGRAEEICAALNRGEEEKVRIKKILAYLKKKKDEVKAEPATVASSASAAVYGTVYNYVKRLK